MKKKYFNMTLALLACAGVITMTGCGKKDPFTVYSDAAKKTAELSSMEMTYDIDMTLELAGESMDMTTSSTAKMSGMNTDDMKINMAMKVGAQGQEMDMNVYYTDGYYYADSMGTKMKYLMDLEQAQKELASTGLQTDMKKEDFKAISLEAEDQVVGMVVLSADQTAGDILTVSQSGLGRRTDSEEYRLQTRGGKGLRNYYCDKNGPVAGFEMVDDQTDIILITDSGIIIRIPADQISKQSRYAGGVKVMRVDDQTSIIGIAVTEKEEESEETEDTASLPKSAQPSTLEDSDKQDEPINQLLERAMQPEEE